MKMNPTLELPDKGLKVIIKKTIQQGIINSLETS